MNAPRVIFSGFPKTRDPETGNESRGGYFMLAVGAQSPKFTLEQTGKDGDYVTYFDVKLAGVVKAKAVAKIQKPADEIRELLDTRIPIGVMTIKWEASKKEHEYFICFSTMKTTRNTGWTIYAEMPRQYEMLDDGL